MQRRDYWCFPKYAKAQASDLLRVLTYASDRLNLFQFFQRNYPAPQWHPYLQEQSRVNTYTLLRRCWSCFALRKHSNIFQVARCMRKNLDRYPNLYADRNGA